VAATVTVREYARLSTQQVTASLDQATVSQADYDWLCKINSSMRAGGMPLVRIEGREWLKVDNYVGVVETPSGTRIEILPKHHDEADDVAASRALLCKMIQASLDLPTRDVGFASLMAFETPLTEWVIRQFLNTLDALVKRGMRFDYECVEEEQRFLRGQLDVARQLRQPVHRRHFFQTRHDVFSVDGPENRLLRRALEIAASRTADARNWQLAHELLGRTAEIRSCSQIKFDLRAWRTDRLMAHYLPVRPWCQLILQEQMPLAVLGDWHGISLLFPMEKLFERYVATSLRTAISPDWTLKTQAASRYLCAHLGEDFFQLKPDMLLMRNGDSWVLDTKWKRLDFADRKGNYGLSQGDFYQLFAYGHRYLEGAGRLILIYPKTRSFQTPLQPFCFSETMELWVLPFDLATRTLVQPLVPILPCAVE
jgi:5-methylcytosine-specific restriction enzyme subunit McrC